jgi:hypothetical protein
MFDLFGPGTIAGYCTNVHAGASLEQTLANLKQYALAIKQKVTPDAPMGVGLWLANPVVEYLIKENRIQMLKAFLDSHGLVAFTFNGFPYGNFHEQVVKKSVYQPDWSDTQRLDYTKNLATLLAQLTPEGQQGSISTLPLGWLSEPCDAGFYEASAENLLKLAEFLAQMEKETGRLIHIAIEPEPGCVLDTAEDVIHFYQTHLLSKGKDEIVLRYLRICHDICHSAVMFEEQPAAIKAYEALGIKIGKVQISSAVQAAFARMDDETARQAYCQLKSFDEQRYLHQTCIAQKNSNPDSVEFYDDLSLAIASNPPCGIWRTHFHLPIFLETFGLLQSTQNDIIRCLDCIQHISDCKHFEVETYAWNVLPATLQCHDLSEGIAQELLWLRKQYSKDSHS